MKKNERVTREFEENLVDGVAVLRDLVQPQVGAAYDWAKPRWEKGVETAGPALQDTARKTAAGISGGIAVVTPKIQDGLDKVGPRISQVVDGTAPKLQGTLDKAAPALNSAKGKVVDDYLPLLSTRLGEAADSASRSLAGISVPAAVDKAVEKATGDKKAVSNAQKRLTDATKQVSKDLKKNKPRKSGKGWLIFGIIASAVVAGVAAWRASRPVEDPWKTPAPIKATPAPVSSQKSQDTKVVVADLKADDAKSGTKGDDKADDTKNKVAEAAKTAADKVKDATSDAKDKVEDAKNKAAETSKTTADKAKDATGQAKDKADDAKNSAAGTSNTAADKAKDATSNAKHAGTTDSSVDHTSGRTSTGNPSDKPKA